jgi:hypothetical protein
MGDASSQLRLNNIRRGRSLAAQKLSKSSQTFEQNHRRAPRSNLAFRLVALKLLRMENQSEEWVSRFAR